MRSLCSLDVYVPISAFVHLDNHEISYKSYTFAGQLPTSYFLVSHSLEVLKLCGNRSSRKFAAFVKAPHLVFIFKECKATAM